MPLIASKEISLCFAEAWSMAMAKWSKQAQFFKNYGIDQINFLHALG